MLKRFFKQLSEQPAVAPHRTAFVRCPLSFVLTLALAALAPSAFAFDGSQVVTGGGTVDFTGVSSTNWVKNANGGLDFLLVYSNATEKAASFTLPSITSMRILAVGGGGGGGGLYRTGGQSPYGGGAGGGAGGFVEVTNVYGAATYAVKVGAGGEAGKNGTSATTDYSGGDGEPTTISTNGIAMLTALGGGGGGGQSPGHAAERGLVGSGGGGSQKRNPNKTTEGIPQDPGLGTEGQGHDGGAGDAAVYGGGGGGAGAPGQSALSGNPVGGDGRPSDITVDYGTSEANWPWYAGGGGGADSARTPTGATSGIAGGKGGGGQGGCRRSPKEGGEATSGTDGTGGGGGGAAANTSTPAAGAGGSGIVYVRIAGLFDGKKPQDQQIPFDGEAHCPIAPSPFLEIEGNDPVSAAGVYTARAKPKDNLKWDDDTADWVSVTLVIYEPGMISGTVDVTGAPVSFVGAVATNWVLNAEGKYDFLVGFSGQAGTFTLPGSSQVRILAVGGGGGGGGLYRSGGQSPYGGGAGGGAGGFVEVTNVYGAATYAVKVGAGGEAGKNGTSATTDYSGRDGEPTTISTNGIAMLTALGGGGGGGQSPGHTAERGLVGSGGGGSQKRNPDKTTEGIPQDPGLGTEGQGHDGGAGDAAIFGGGGGGAGAAGQPASSGNPVGGDGLPSDITNHYGAAESAWGWFAGGGGGADSARTPTGATSGIAGGKGGGGQGGCRRSPAEGGEAKSGDPMTGGGGGGAAANTSTPSAGAGGSGVVWVRISSAMTGEFKKPTDPAPIVYDANAHTSLVDNVFYWVEGDYVVDGANVGTTVGVYQAVAHLRDGAVWPEGGREDVTNRMTIVPCPVTKLKGHIDNWEFIETKTPEPTGEVEPAIAQPLVFAYAPRVAGQEGKDVPAEAWTDEKPTDVATYWLRTMPKDDWNFSFTPDYYPFAITKVLVTVDNLRQRGWLFGTPDADTPRPTFDLKPATSTISNLLVFAYAPDPGGDPAAIPQENWSDEKPTAVGNYVLRLDIIDKDNFELVDGIHYVRFSIADGLGAFTDYIEIVVPGYTGTTPPPPLTNFPCKVTLSETSPVGFLYARAGATGNEMTFTLADGRTVLPYAVESWETNGTSVVFVQLPEITTEEQTIRLYWHLHDEQSAPDHYPERVWEAWTREDWDKIAKKPTLSFAGAVSRNGYLVNYFAVQPEMTKYLWDKSDAVKGAIKQDAKLAFDNNLLVRTFTNVVAQVGYDELPTDIVGSFRVCYTLVDPSEQYEPLECHMDYAVSGRTPQGDLRGGTLDLTRTGRVLLMNDDVLDETHTVTNQSYWQTREVDRGDGTIMTNDVFWTHEGTVSSYSSLSPNLLGGCSHRLYALNADGTTNLLWRLENCRIGNAVGANSKFAGNRLNLPWSKTGRAIKSYAAYTDRGKDGDINEVGQIVMRNMGDEDKVENCAVVYSPCYSNGIGTIYFDAVNGQNDYIGDKAYRLVVEVATATFEGKTPTDENAFGPNDDGLEEELGKIRKAQWHKVDVVPLFHNGVGSAFVRQAATNDVSLEANVLASTNHFYRLCVNVNYQGPCRFRIRRVSSVPITYVEVDKNEFIQLDNIIVAYPNMTATMEPFGEYDGTKAGKTILGQQAAMAVPFPAAGETDVRARVKVTPYVNEFVSKRPEDVVLRAQMHYRWRYLDQAFGTNCVVDIWPADGYVSQDKLQIPADEGDMEFWFTATLNVPSYQYYDYSGANLGLKKADGTAAYSDECLTVTNRAHMADYDADLPSGGTNWFFRLRAGASAYEGIRLLTMPKAGGAVTTNEMEVVGDKLWRGCVPTPDALADGLLYRFEAYNRQVENAATYARNVTYWKGEEKLKALPSDIPLAAGANADDWSEVPCDALTGYLLFRIDETKKTIYVARADCQDFNRWATAVNTNGLFVGSSTDTNSTTYIAKQIDIDWTKMPPSSSTNGHWIEDFSVTTGQVARLIYPRDEPFTEWYDNGWTLENGMWTYGKWAIETEEGFGDATALQLEGHGRGCASMTGATDVPDGIDQIRFTARLAQFNEFGNFAYYNKNDVELIKNTAGQITGARLVEATSLSNYTFCASAGMTITGEDSFAGDGSVSLVANYYPQRGAYEFRVSRGTSKSHLRLALYRWANKNGAVSCEFLGSEDYLDKGNKTDPAEYPLAAEKFVRNWKNSVSGKLEMGKLGGLYISVYDDGQGTVVKAGVYRGDAAPDNPSAMMGANKAFTSVAYYDKSADRRRSGTFGVLARSCPGVFTMPIYYKTAVATAGWTGDPFKPDADKSSTISVTGSSVDALPSIGAYDNWVIDTGRSSKIEGGTFGTVRGFQAVDDVKQSVLVQSRPHGTDKWETISTNEVVGFTDTTYPIMVRSTVPSDVRLKMLAPTNGDVRTDMTITSLQLTQWVGQWTQGYDEPANWGFTNRWVYTSAWVNEYVDGGSTNRTVLLQPTRAKSATTPVSLRTPLLRGFGLIHVAWRNADARSKALVQIATGATRNNLISLTEASPNGTGWETLETLDFAKLGASGSKSVYVNKRYPYQGALRIVIAQDVTKAALADGMPRKDPTYGQVEITDAFAWDLPEYDMHSWLGWNFRAEGWDGTTAGAFANLVDGGAEHGLSGLLNNTLDASTLADDFTDYQAKPPHVQSPTFGTNCIGAVDFRARLYGLNDLKDKGHPAVLTIYGARKKDEFGEPTDWTPVADAEFAVSNGFYRTFTQRFRPSDKFFAIRFGVKGVAVPGGGTIGGETPTYDPPLRVAIDDICIYERPPLTFSFRKLHVRPFRNADAVKGTEAVDDITSVDEQPLLGEAFGFQAEVNVQSDEILTDDPAHPIEVELWYYPEKEPWGWDNWKDLPGAKHMKLKNAVGENLIFRSTMDNEGSVCAPQVLKKDETYKIVQYQLVATYWDKSLDNYPHQMSAQDWTMPSWNTGFENPNEKDGANFSGFTLLEAIAPKRAWINEVNYVEDASDAEKSKKDQWVELAVPSGVDLAGWQLKLYDMNGDFAGNLLTFGDGKAPGSKMTPNAYNGYDFYVVQSPFTQLAGADATWTKITTPLATVSEGVLTYTQPYAFELVRPTGVVEHRAVTQGYNFLRGMGIEFAYMYDGTNLVRILNEKADDDSWVWAAEDFGAYPGCTLGVTNGWGGTHADWGSPLGRTPGERNQGQYIDPDWFVRPNGGYYWINALVQGQHMRQIIGAETNLTATITLQEGGTTSLVYEVDRWYKLGPWSVTPTGGSMSAPWKENGKSYYRLTLANVTNQTTVTATDAVSDELAGLGVTDDNRYKNAIMKWLENGDFKGDTIQLGEWRGHNGEEHEEINLTSLYWLDLDPTCGGWELWGGMGEKGGTQKLGPLNGEVVRTNQYDTTQVHTNIQTTVWLMITNARDKTIAARPPYRLQGLNNEQSDSFGGVWTSETFKVMMMMKTSDESIKSQFHAMRQFVFGPDSFRPANDAVAPFAARVEVTDPFSRQSPAWEWGWWRYAEQGIRPWTKFALDENISPAGVSTLKKDDLLVW